MKYASITNGFASLLYRVIDRLDWGHVDAKTGKAKYVNPNWLLEARRAKLGGCRPQRVTKTNIQHHLRAPFIHYTSSASSGFCLVCIDVDAHEGQTDAFETACWLRDSFFVGSYLEPSARGYHLYVMFEVGYVRRKTFNFMLTALETDLRILLGQTHFSSTVEVLGGFTEWEGTAITCRQHLAPLPGCPNGQPDVDWMKRMPVYPCDKLAAVHYEATLQKDMDALMADDPSLLPDDCLSQRPKPVKEAPTTASGCAWERMQSACFAFTATHRRLPTEDELLDYYQSKYDADAGDDERRRRALYAIRYRAKTFDPDRCSTGGYEGLKPRLLAAVERHCRDRTCSYTKSITDEDLAIALYEFHIASFSRHDRPEEQWTVGNEAVIGMFRRLKEAGATSRGCAEPNKAVALKTILLRANLIECLDSKYIPAGGKGISKKYTISTNHWLYSRWVAWAETVRVKKVDQIMEAKAERSRPAIWNCTVEADVLLT